MHFEIDKKIKQEYISVKRIINSNNTENSDEILKNLPCQPLLLIGRTCKLKKNGYILLDFGEELQGGILITVHKTTSSNAMLHVVLGESVMEAMSRLGDKNSGNDHSLRDFSFPVSSLCNFRTGDSGFRFAKLEALNCDIEILSVNAVSELRNIDYKGSFESSDKLLNQIWRTGAKTVHLNMQDYLWDGIKRDRLVWAGDMHPEVATVCSVFGYDACVPKTLDFIKDNTQSDKWMNEIPSYTFWWLIIQLDWFMNNGNIEYLRQQKNYIIDVVRNISSHINSDGSYIFEDYFIDWETIHDTYLKSGFHAILITALRAALKIGIYLDNKDIEEGCLQILLLLEKRKPPYNRNKQIAALLSLADVYNSDIINKEVLSINPVSGISAFLGYYTLLARAKCGDVAGSVDVIKNYWGKMIELGATSFWESFDIAWAENSVGIDKIVPKGKNDIHGDFGKDCYKQFRRSLCHGWASGPTPFLSRYVLGVNILEPGGKKIQISPFLGEMDYVKGSFPTVYGNIYIEHKKENGIIVTDYDAPKEIEVLSS